MYRDVANVSLVIENRKECERKKLVVRKEFFSGSSFFRCQGHRCFFKWDKTFLLVSR